MRQCCIFSGTSHPNLVSAICERLGQKPSEAALKKFSNGETSVEIKTSIRDKDVFIVQSGSGEINDNVMEMLIMIAACKGGSSRSITAVMPYFPYSRQSKKKSHRGSITARMLANLMKVAGVNHVITIDLHATQMQGFFKCPVDNLFAEPILIKWIRMNMPNWRDCVVVSKNPGGSKRVTSLADKLGVAFGIVTTDRRKPHSFPSQFSTITGSIDADAYNERNILDEEMGAENIVQRDWAQQGAVVDAQKRSKPANGENTSSPLANTDSPKKAEPSQSSQPPKPPAAPKSVDGDGYEDSEGEDGSDERAMDVIKGRLIHGHIVDDDVPSPSASQYSGYPHAGEDDQPDPMVQSFMSTTSSRWAAGNGAHQGLGGTADATHSDEEEEEALQNPHVEATVTLVGNVRNKAVLIVDDMLDKASSWIAAAETVVKRGGATKVYCMATHGLFGDDCLQELEACREIQGVIVTNTFPIPEEKRRGIKKLIVLDVSGLLAEAIRRNHHGESISQLYHLQD